MNSNEQYISECSRCGECCRKGGPALHVEDIRLVEKGWIALECLYTIRAGERAFDNVRERLENTTGDIIKIKGRPGSRTCIFLDEKNNDCTIHENRPVECRALKCWDTREIERIYSRNRLARKDLVSNIEGLWGLVEEHQAQCGYDRIMSLMKNLISS